MSKERIIKEAVGHCPKCGSDRLEYDEPINDGENLVYPFACIDCEIEGEEVYEVNYLYSDCETEADPC